MQNESGSALLTLLVIGVAVFWLVRRLRVFRGFSTGFWSGFFTRLFVGTLRSPTGSGHIEKLLKWLIVGFVLFVILAWLAQRS